MRSFGHYVFNLDFIENKSFYINQINHAIKKLVYASFNINFFCINQFKMYYNEY